MTNLPGLNADWIVNPYQLTLTQQGQLVLPFDPTRFFALFSSQSGQTVSLFYGSLGISGQGIIVGQSLPPFAINFRDHPGIVAGPWYAIPGAPMVTFYVIESLYRPPMGD